MRLFVVGWLALLLSGCSPQSETSPDVLDDAMSFETSLTFDGADYGTDEKAKRAHGERLSWVLNCRGCHEPDLTGKMFPPGLPFDTGVYSANLTRVVGEYSNNELERLLREGVHPERENLWMMPSYLYRHLSDADMEALIAHLKSLEPMGDPTPVSSPTEATRQSYEGFPLTSVEGIAWADRQPMPDLGEEFALGRHYAMMTCAECHGPDLRGLGNFSPDLRAMATAYSADELSALLSEGAIKEDREVYLMDHYGANIASRLTDNERNAIIAFVKELAAIEVQ